MYCGFFRYSAHLELCMRITISITLSIPGQSLMRTIKEALYIRVNNPSLNKNIGKYHLPHMWDEVLFNTSELKLKQTDPVAIPSGTWQ